MAILSLIGLVAAGAAWYWRPPAVEKNAPPPPAKSVAAQPRAAQPAAEAAPVEAKAVAAAHPTGGYVGPQVCGECHAEKLTTFQKTSHFEACRAPNSKEVPPWFAPGKNKFSTSDPAVRFETSARDGVLEHTLIRDTAAGEDRATSRVDLMYGVGNADSVYFSWHGDRLQELPLAWIYTLGQWGTASWWRAYQPDQFQAGDGSRPTTIRCVECHNTWLEHTPGTGNQFRRDKMILGVTCENCHGPGQAHLDFQRSHPQAAAQEIVHPGKLIRERQLDICTQCHSNAIRPRGPAFQFRPGKPLRDFYKILTVKHSEDDHVANQIDRLRESKCFQKNEQLTCTTCHDPHRAAAPEKSNDACRKCHQPDHCRERPQLPAAVRDECVHCHMPLYVKTNVHFFTENDAHVPPIRRASHRIGIYPAAQQELLLQWRRTLADEESRQEATKLQQSLVEHWLREAEKCRGEYRFLGAMAAIREGLRFDSSSPLLREKLRDLIKIQTDLDEQWGAAIRQVNQRQYSPAIDTLQKILEINPQLSSAQGKLGTLYGVMGKRDLAVSHLQKVAQIDPDDSYGISMLAWMALLDGKAEESAQLFRAADEIEPYNAKTNFQWGLALVQLARWPEAAEHFRRAAEVDPKYVSAWQALAATLGKQGRFEEALPFAKRAADLAGDQNVDVLITLADSYLAAGRLPDAERVALRAAQIVPADKPALQRPIQKILDQIRALKMPDTEGPSR